jgi:hypothetical protein
MTDVPDTKGQFPWESSEPTHFARGFRVSGAMLTIHAAYAIYPQGVLLLTYLETPQGTNPWQRVWTPRENAVEAAENLAGAAEHYLTADLGITPRPVEDLDLDDFIEHLSLRLNHALH